MTKREWKVFYGNARDDANYMDADEFEDAMCRHGKAGKAVLIALRYVPTPWPFLARIHCERLF